MKENFKSFDKKLHQKHDALGKRATRRFFTSLGFIVRNHPNSKAKSDLVLFVSEEKLDLLEVFHSVAWKAETTKGNWPWAHYNILHRKTIGLSEKKTMHWIGISEDSSYLAFLDGDKAFQWIQTHNHEEFANRVFQSGERVYRVPAELVETYPLERKIEPVEYGPCLKALVDRKAY